MSADTEVPDSVTHREIQEVVRTFASSGWTSMTLDVRGMRITVGKNGPPTGTAPAAAPVPAVPPAPGAAATATTGTTPVAAPPATAAPPTAGSGAPPVDTTGCVEVRSPAVGAFWVAPSPGEPPFVQVGQVVGQHEQLAIVEVMKLMNPVIALQPGEIVQICASDAEMVEYDQVLFLIRPTDE